jgi:hypothetical protein
VTDVLTEVRARLNEHFAAAGIAAEPISASVTFLGAEPIEVLRYGPDGDGVHCYVSLGCSRHPMIEPTEMIADPTTGPRAEVVVSLRGPTPTGLARSIAVVAAAPAVEGLVLTADALVDLETPLWELPDPPGRPPQAGGAPTAPGPRGAPFTAVLLGASDIGDVELAAPVEPVTVLSATPITATEAAWVRLKGAEAMREAWRVDGVDVLDPARPAAQPK